LHNGNQERQERDLGHGKRMLGFNIQASETSDHDNQRPTNQCFCSVIVNGVPILFGFKSLPNAEAVEVVHLDFAKEKRDAHSNEYEPEANESDCSL
jgi:hypothetical protein